MFELRESKLRGCYQVLPRKLSDERGDFVKVFHSDAFAELGLETNFVEEYYSVSKKGVIRGMHFQVPPEDHVKMVYCLRGKVFDVVLDLRVNSPTYGEFDTFILSSDDPSYLYIPKGIAHGFCALTDGATLVYKVSSVYSSAHDAGVLWSSVGVDWPVGLPTVSGRDSNLIPFDLFSSPFVNKE